MAKHLSIHILLMCLALSVGARAQDLEGNSSSSPENSSAAQVEEVLEKEEVKQEQRKAGPRAEVLKSGLRRLQNLSDLATLAPFSDVAVIQRRFLPKTKRFEISGTAFTNLNNPFFNAIGGSARLAYYLREQYAIEGIAAFSSTSNRQVTDDLLENRRISTASVVTAKSFYAVAFKWNPIYGKITWLNRSIVPFDLNFDAGFGSTQTADGQSAPTLHLSTSQVFALSKAMAFRWDFIFNTYSAHEAGNTASKITQNDLYLGLGMSFYFPEATYR